MRGGVNVKILCSVVSFWVFFGISFSGDFMKSILQYGQAIKACKRAKTVKSSVAVAASAGDALRDGYRLKDYVKVNNGSLSYWRKERTT